MTAFVKQKGNPMRTVTEEQKARRAEYSKQYRCNNKARLADYNKEYGEEYRQKHKARSAEYRQKNKGRHAAYGKEYRQKNKARDAISRRYRKYGITDDQLKQMFIAQEAKCAICGFRFTTSKELCVDHNHTTNQVRQLLCRPCNAGLGYFRENSTTLLKAAEYLNKWN